MKTSHFDRSVYTIEAAKRAAYDLPKGCHPKVSATKHTITVHFFDQDDKYEPMLCDGILDHQIRLETEEKFGLIRTILVAQAINPRGDLDRIIDKIYVQK